MGQPLAGAGGQLSAGARSAGATTRRPTSPAEKRPSSSLWPAPAWAKDRPRARRAPAGRGRSIGSPGWRRPSTRAPRSTGSTASPMPARAAASNADRLFKLRAGDRHRHLLAARQRDGPAGVALRAAVDQGRHGPQGRPAPLAPRAAPSRRARPPSPRGWFRGDASPLGNRRGAHRDRRSKPCSTRLT